MHVYKYRNECTIIYEYMNEYKHSVINTVTKSEKLREILSI